MPRRRGLKNPHGSRAVTSDPVPAEKPDLRRYPVNRKSAPEGLTFPEQLAFRSRLRQTKPAVTRWRDAHGVVDQDGDVKTFTGKCQRSGCGRWFSVTRTPATVNARWPEFCSTDCRDSHDGARRRRNSRRLRAGDTSGDQQHRVIYPTFDPAAPGAWERAYEIVNQQPYVGADGYRSLPARTFWATGAVFAAAEAYLAECQQEVAESTDRYIDTL